MFFVISETLSLQKSWILISDFNPQFLSFYYFNSCITVFLYWNSFITPTLPISLSSNPWHLFMEKDWINIWMSELHNKLYRSKKWAVFKKNLKTLFISPKVKAEVLKIFFKAQHEIPLYVSCHLMSLTSLVLCSLAPTTLTSVFFSKYYMQTPASGLYSALPSCWHLIFLQASAHLSPSQGGWLSKYSLLP